jgi:predicted O-methyltransferase YrrM
VEVRVGQALNSLSRLAEEGAGPFDMVFIDADKENNSAYFEWGLKLSRRGSVIVVDNVVRYGAQDTTTYKGSVRRFMELIAKDPRVTATVIQTVSVKGHDGFALAVVTSGESGRGPG